MPNLVLIALFMWITRWFIDLYGTIGGLHYYRLDAYMFWLLTLDVIGVALIGYWVNDWMDRDIDLVNKPDRLLAQNQIDARHFWLFILAFILVLGGLSTWLAVKLEQTAQLWIFPVSVGSLLVYAFWLRKVKLLGNVLVSALISALVYLIWLAEIYEGPGMTTVMHHPKLNIVLGIYALFMFLANWSREMIKDVEDLEGDRLNKVISFPILLGAVSTYRLAVLPVFLLVLLEAVLVFYLGFSPRTLIAGILVTITALYLIFLLFKGPDNYPAKTVSNRMKILMFIGLIQLVIIGF